MRRQDRERKTGMSDVGSLCDTMQSKMESETGKRRLTRAYNPREISTLSTPRTSRVPALRDSRPPPLISGEQKTVLQS